MARTKKLIPNKRSSSATHVTSDVLTSTSQHRFSHAKPSVKAANLKSDKQPRGKRRTVILLRILQQVEELLKRCLSSRKSLTVPAFHIQDLMQQVLGTIRKGKPCGSQDFYNHMCSSQSEGFEGVAAPMLAEKVLQGHGDHKKYDSHSDATQETLVLILEMINYVLHHSLKNGTPNLEGSAMVILDDVGHVLTCIGRESWHRVLQERIKRNC